MQGSSYKTKPQRGLPHGSVGASRDGCTGGQPAGASSATCAGSAKGRTRHDLHHLHGDACLLQVLEQLRGEHLPVLQHAMGGEHVRACAHKRHMDQAAWRSKGGQACSGWPHRHRCGQVEAGEAVKVVGDVHVGRGPGRQQPPCRRCREPTSRLCNCERWIPSSLMVRVYQQEQCTDMDT